MAAKLYVILGSHACRTGMLLLEHKRIEYQAVTLPTGAHPFLVRALGFGSRAARRQIGNGTNPMLASMDRMGTVPALKMDGQKVKTNLRIARFLDEVRPDPPLFPADAERRSAVEEAERWGDDVFQMAARRLALTGALHGPQVFDGNDGRLGPLLWRSTTMRRVAPRLVARIFGASGKTEPEMLADLGPMLDRIDGWIADGTLNGPQLNAADLMIAPSLALLWYRTDLRPRIEGRPAYGLMDRVVPERV